MKLKLHLDKILEEEYITQLIDMQKLITSINLKYWDVNNLYGWEMSQTFHKKLYHKKTVMIKEMKDISWKLIFNNLKICMNSIMVYHFYQEE